MTITGTSSQLRELSTQLDACGCSLTGEEVSGLIDQALDRQESPQVLASAILDRCSAFDEHGGEKLFQSVFTLWNDKAREWNRLQRLN